MSYETILVEVDAEGVAWLTFNRPEVRNALNQAMVDDVRVALRELGDRSDVRVLVIMGAGGKAFLGGADIGELRDRKAADALRRINSDLFRELEAFALPTIAAISGFALGGGCEVALACDLRICGESARLGQPEVGLGIIPGAGATYRLPRLVGLGRAKELIFTGRILRAGEAHQIGLVEQVVPDDELKAAAAKLASSIAKNSALAVRLAKTALNAQAGGGTDAWQALESASQAILFDDAEKRERMTAFLERKKKGKASKAFTLRVTGAVKTELSLDYEALASLESGAQVGDVSTLVPNKSGRAVRVGSLLERAGVHEGATFVRAATADGEFFTTQPMEIMKGALLVYSLRGQPLANDRGGPQRLLIPNHEDACANVKNVTVIEVTREDLGGACGHSAEQHGEIRAKRKT